MTDYADLSDLLLSRIRDVADYPEPGVMFKDITPLLADPKAFDALTGAFANVARRAGATKVVGLEARGFILGAPVAVRAAWASSPSARRASSQGPPSARRTTWSTARPRSRSTRRTSAPRTASWSSTTSWPPAAPAEASLQLIRRAGAEVAGLAVLMELGFLGGRARLEPALAGAPLEALLRL